RGRRLCATGVGRQSRQTARISRRLNFPPPRKRGGSINPERRAAGPAWRESMKTARNLIAMAALLATTSAFAQYTDRVVKIGVLRDLSSLYADIGGPGSVAAAKLAVEDFGAAAKGIKVEIVSGDHQNKPDVGASIAGSWFDVDKVDVIVDVPNSGVAL